ncbi:uncharacterized protein LOC134219525 [Armigeres subalbatus]|uniref:uncharacterized protein LOC134219525 n=1 Tax=Armigeres subalbatus TaxID=124917 RepID=UPI002ECFC291
MIPILSLVTTAFISPTLAVDWYAWTQANYAAIQHGLAQLNDAAKQMNNSIIQQQNRVEHGMDSIDSFVRQSLLATWSQYPNLKFSADQMQRMMSSIHKANRFKTYVSDTADGYKRSVTSNVMIPAQAIVQSILSAMTTIYDKQQKCSSYASQLVQPRTAIGRLQYCVLLAVPYFETVTNTTLSLFDHGKNTVTTLISLLGSCSPGSTSCVSKFMDELPDLLNNVVNAISVLYVIPLTAMKPGKLAVQECVSLITEDIKQTVKELVHRILSC